MEDYVVKKDPIWSKFSTAQHTLLRQRPRWQGGTVKMYRAEMVWVELDDEGNPIEQPERPVRRDDRGLLGNALGDLD